jgi:hypothetical protein
MLKKRCYNCEKKIDRSFRFCPWCGKCVKKIKQEDYGMLGFNDESEPEVQNPLSLFGGGLGMMVNQLTKQLSKELQNLDGGDEGKPKGIEIRFSTGKPIQRVVRQAPQDIQEVDNEEVSEREEKRRKILPVEVAESKIRRLPEGIIYEISAPGVKSKKDISIIRMEDSLEIRAYSKDKCYIKTIPVKVDILKYGVRDDKVFVQIKN